MAPVTSPSCAAIRPRRYWLPALAWDVPAIPDNSRLAVQAPPADPSGQMPPGSDPRIVAEAQRELASALNVARLDPDEVAALLKRWLPGTLQGGIQHQHLDYYLDEFTFRFNRRRSKTRGLLFHRLAQQAVAVGPSPYHVIISGQRPQLG